MNRGSLLSLLCALAGPISSFTTNPLVIHSLKLWYQLRSHFKRTELSLIASLHRHCMFPPSLMDEAVIIWTELRVTSMNALFADNIFCSFGQLVSKFKIPQSLFFFRCLQLKYFVVSNIDCFPSCPSPSLLHKVFDLKPDAKWVTDVYELLSNHKLPTLQSLRGTMGKRSGPTDCRWDLA